MNTDSEEETFESTTEEQKQDSEIPAHLGYDIGDSEIPLHLRD